ncbi:hypothetical protein [Hydrogenophaga soli]|nr:hypothetical protein [Burkholderiaceae bacterium]
MKKFIVSSALFLGCSTLALAATGGLDGFLSNLNVQARADRDGFSARISAQFGVPDAQVRVVMSSVPTPADAYMVFQLGQMTHQPHDRVLGTYKANKGKGWGVVAKEMGIKPGSPEFHALKRGEFQLTGAAPNVGDDSANPGKGHGRSNGHGGGNGGGNGHGKH